MITASIGSSCTDELAGREWLQTKQGSGKQLLEPWHELLLQSMKSPRPGVQRMYPSNPWIQSKYTTMAFLSCPVFFLANLRYHSFHLWKYRCFQIYRGKFLETFHFPLHLNTYVMFAEFGVFATWDCSSKYIADWRHIMVFTVLLMFHTSFQSHSD